MTSPTSETRTRWKSPRSTAGARSTWTRSGPRAPRHGRRPPPGTANARPDATVGTAVRAIAVTEAATAAPVVTAARAADRAPAKVVPARLASVAGVPGTDEPRPNLDDR